MKIGHIVSMEINNKPVTSARAKDGQIAVKIEGESQIMFGRHFDDTH